MGQIAEERNVTLDLTKPIRIKNHTQCRYVYIGRAPDAGDHAICYLGYGCSEWQLEGVTDRRLNDEFENIPEVKESFANVYVTRSHPTLHFGAMVPTLEEAIRRRCGKIVGTVCLKYDGVELVANVLPANGD
jgi:hypothetical protein